MDLACSMVAWLCWMPNLIVAEGLFNAPSRGMRRGPARHAARKLHPMNPDEPLHDFLVLSRGQWDRDRSSAEIQAAIDAFYAWYEQLVADGQVVRGHRLARGGKVVSRHGIADGPFVETKELIGGYWVVRARSLDAAAELMSHNPTIACGLAFEVRPLEHQRASAYVASNETPLDRRAGR